MFSHFFALLFNSHATPNQAGWLTPPLPPNCKMAPSKSCTQPYSAVGCAFRQSRKINGCMAVLSSCSFLLWHQHYGRKRLWWWKIVIKWSSIPGLSRILPRNLERLKKRTFLVFFRSKCDVLFGEDVCGKCKIIICRGCSITLRKQRGAAIAGLLSLAGPKPTPKTWLVDKHVYKLVLLDLSALEHLGCKYRPKLREYEDIELNRQDIRHLDGGAQFWFEIMGCFESRLHMVVWY